MAAFTLVTQPKRRPLVPPLPSFQRGRGVGTDVVLAAGLFVTVVVGLWVRHGGITALAQGWAKGWTSLAQVSGLVAAAAGVLGLALAAWPRSVERRVGLDRVFLWHRYLGEATEVLLGMHIATALAAWSADVGFWSALRELSGGLGYMAAATVGAALIGLVTVTSLRSIRRRLAFETWYFIHLLAYLGLALSFAHELVLDGDLSHDGFARGFWIGAHVAVVAALEWGRWGRLLWASLHPLRVSAVRRLNAETAEIELSGTSLRGHRADPGQFYLLRPMQRHLWWQAHPFSLSGAPDDRGLRFTVKARGDASTAITELAHGTAVVVEGPYGACTPAVLAGRSPLFVAGGVGVAPVRIHRPDGSLDPAGFVKGWAVQRAARFLDEAGLGHWYLGIGGDLQTRGTRLDASPWRVAIADPLRREQVAARLDVVDAAVATSGTAERGGHLWAGRGVAAAPAYWVSLTVTGPELTWADAFATAGFALGADGLGWVARFDGYAALGVTTTGEVLTSGGFRSAT